MSSRTKDPHGLATRTKPKRAQVSKACQRCKRLQKGCSETRPCARCIRVGLAEQCFQDDRRLQRTINARTAPYRQQAASRTPDKVITPASPSTSRPWPHALLPAPVIGYCFTRFFEKLYPTIPILSPDYTAVLLADAESPSGGEARCLITAICALVLIQIEDLHQHLFETEGVQHSNGDLGTLLLEQTHNGLGSRFSPTLERTLATFFLYACHAWLCHHSRAFLLLRETVSFWMILRVDEGDGLRQKLADRLFWVILISERSHGIRYRRPISLQVTTSTVILNVQQDTEVLGLSALAALFRPLDTVFFALLNQEDTAFDGNVSIALDAIQASITEALGPEETNAFCETQLANLKVTQLWLLVILWQVRLRLGMLVEQPNVPCHRTFHYPVEVGQDLVDAVRAMSLESVKIHGAGITEKIFDIACAMADVLSRVPLTDSSGSTKGINNVRYLRQLIHQLPRGATTYESLLDKHIRHTLPDLHLIIAQPRRPG